MKMFFFFFEKRVIFVFWVVIGGYEEFVVFVENSFVSGCDKLEVFKLKKCFKFINKRFFLFFVCNL